MMKARAGNLVLVGLSDKNLEELRKGNPIAVHVKELGGDEPIEQLVFFSKPTERDMFDYLKAQGLLPPDLEYTEQPSHRKGPLQ